MTAVLLGEHASGSSWEVVDNSLWSVLVLYTEMFCFCFIMRCRSLSPSRSLHVVLPFLPRNVEVNVRLIWVAEVPRPLCFGNRKPGSSDKLGWTHTGWRLKLELLWTQHSAGAHGQTYCSRRHLSSVFIFSIKIWKFGVFYELSLAYPVVCFVRFLQYFFFFF